MIGIAARNCLSGYLLFKRKYVVLGAENQAKVHYAMPVKDMLYDALNYARQVAETTKSFKKTLQITDDECLPGFRKGDKLIPVSRWSFTSEHPSGMGL